MKIEVKDFKRKDIFDYYNNKDNPFLYLTTRIEITNIYNKCKNYYATIAYFITLALNQIDNFKYRYEDNKIYKYDILNLNFTQMFEDNSIGFFACKFNTKYSDFLVEYKKIQKKFFDNHKSYTNANQGEIWFSYVPWYNINSLITPFDKKITIPQFIWDKFIFENDKYYVNLTIMVHHGFVDGYHISLFLEKLEEIIKNVDKYL